MSSVTASSEKNTQPGPAGRVIFIEGEDPAAFQALYAGLSLDHSPAILTEELLVYRMTEEFWFSRRASQLLAAALDLNAREDNSKQVALMLRYHASSSRGLHKAIEQLRSTQKARLATGIGFVSQDQDKADASGGIGFVSQNQTDASGGIGFVSQNQTDESDQIGFVSQNQTDESDQIGFVSQNPITTRREHPKIGRNEPCPCGSGRKFKRCCLDPASTPVSGSNLESRAA